MRIIIRTFMTIVWLAIPAIADIKVPNCLSDNMVLQQQSEVKLWGWADASEAVNITASWSQTPVSAIADSEGKWSLTVNTPIAGGPYSLAITGANNSITLKDILIGEVWLCSGQSNMQWELKQAENSREYIDTANNPQIRLLYIPRKSNAQPQNDSPAQWQLCTPQTAAGFSAVGYFFGKKLQKELNVPVGLICSAYGGTPAEAWTQRTVIENNPELKPITVRDDEYLANRQIYQDKYQVVLDKWEQDKKDNPKLARPRYPNSLRYEHRSGYLFNSMIHPLLNYRIKGAIWYQGETNVPFAWQYGILLPELINNWRNCWGFELSFLIVQLPPYKYNDPMETTCPELQESQAKTLRLPGTAMAVISDVGDINDVHPRNKLTVGDRLAELALVDFYTMDRPDPHSPTFNSVVFDGQQAIVSFDHAENLQCDGTIREFELAGPDKVFHPASALIDTNKVIVSSHSVTEPIAVRFAWHNSVKPNLFNSLGLPVAPFRSDDWPCSTYEKR
ncbi:MAG: hypothetical protein JW745_03275 [Sedimentisphaerales bacterium]|nr:hypothetical protein [Sedimentisphaerales bacterium]MBN2842372.1 hypothetical protein [Sedimentisphaerales bacterium]